MWEPWNKVDALQRRNDENHARDDDEFIFQLQQDGNREAAIEATGS